MMRAGPGSCTWRRENIQDTQDTIHVASGAGRFQCTGQIQDVDAFHDASGAGRYRMKRESIQGTCEREIIQDTFERGRKFSRWWVNIFRIPMPSGTSRFDEHKQIIS